MSPDGVPRRIEAGDVLYIKLGENGKYERACIQEEQSLRLGYEDVPHTLCVAGRWDEVTECALVWTKDKGAAKRHTNQIRFFYEAPDDTLWVTFHGNRLWWCFSRPEVTVHGDGTKTRPVIGQWRSDDLQASRLSGRILMLQGFRGTICEVRERDYVLRKINGDMEPHVFAAISARDALVDAVEGAIRHFHWRDFELLVDLIFSNAGWKRVSEVGGSQKGVDLVLEAPILSTQYRVQVKSQANWQDLESFRREVADTSGYGGSYFVVHSPTQDLEGHGQPPAGQSVEVLGPRQIAEWSVKLGLVDWIIDKAG